MRIQYLYTVMADAIINRNLNETRADWAEKKKAVTKDLVAVYDLADQKLVADFSKHSFGVSCVAFSPSGRFLASAGFLNDGYLHVYDLEERRVVGSAKMGSTSIAPAMVMCWPGLLGIRPLMPLQNV